MSGAGVSRVEQILFCFEVVSLFVQIYLQMSYRYKCIWDISSIRALDNFFCQEKRQNIILQTSQPLTKEEDCCPTVVLTKISCRHAHQSACQYIDTLHLSCMKRSVLEI